MVTCLVLILTNSRMHVPFSPLLLSSHHICLSSGKKKPQILDIINGPAMLAGDGKPRLNRDSPLATGCARSHGTHTHSLAHAGCADLLPACLLPSNLLIR